MTMYQTFGVRKLFAQKLLAKINWKRQKFSGIPPNLTNFSFILWQWLTRLVELIQNQPFMIPYTFEKKMDFFRWRFSEKIFGKNYKLMFSGKITTCKPAILSDDLNRSINNCHRSFRPHDASVDSLMFSSGGISAEKLRKSRKFHVFKSFQHHEKMETAELLFIQCLNSWKPVDTVAAQGLIPKLYGTFSAQTFVKDDYHPHFLESLCNLAGFQMLKNWCVNFVFFRLSRKHHEAWIFFGEGVNVILPKVYRNIWRKFLFRCLNVHVLAPSCCCLVWVDVKY